MKRFLTLSFVFSLLLLTSAPVLAQRGGCAPPAQDICVVTVDSVNFDHNIIVWEKVVSTEIDSFFIYRQNSFGTWIKIGATTYAADGEFHDFGVNPSLGNSRYKISVYDVCGNESTMSLYHETIFVLYLGGGTFSYNDYSVEVPGSNPASYVELMRDDIPSGVWNAINSGSTGMGSMDDFGYASFPSALYHINMPLGNGGCDPARAVNHNSTRSNRTNSIVGSGISALTQSNLIEVLQNQQGAYFNLRYSGNNPSEKISVSVVAANGQIISTEQLNASSLNGKNFSTSFLSKGIYFIQVQGENFVESEKIVIL